MRPKTMFVALMGALGMMMTLYAGFEAFQLSNRPAYASQSISQEGRALRAELDALLDAPELADSPYKTILEEFADDAISASAPATGASPQPCTRDGVPGVKFKRQCVTKDATYISVMPGELGWLTDLEHRDQVNQIRLQFVKADTLDALEGFSGMRILEVVDADIDDISVLSSFPELKVLRLSGNIGGDLSFVPSLPNLEALHLEGLTTTDLTPIAGLSALKRLHIEDSPVTD
ncbi:MAG: hypothetical protein AAGA78_13465, partial [Pseudomonadota bacterium]